MPRPIGNLDINYELGNAGRIFSPDGKQRVVTLEPDTLEHNWSTEELGDYRLGNSELPVFDFRDEITNTIAENPVTIIVAKTGAGKSTQVPQFLLDTNAYNHIYVTQPRRPAAKGVYQRMREEIREKRGFFAGEELVSFQTAVDREGSEDATIRVVTDGLQLVHELHDKGILENDVLIIDEVHEWNSNVEVLVAWTKKAIKENPSLRVVLMSATMDADKLAGYYANVCPEAPPIIEVDGETYGVDRIDRPDATVPDVAIEIIQLIRQGSNKDGNEVKVKAPDSVVPGEPQGILIFEPGKREIQDAIDEIERRVPNDMRKFVKIFPLHARLSPEEQDAAIREYPGFIKVVVATDVAEASITIPDIKYVIDSGYRRQSDVDHEGTKGLSRVLTSRANCMQRSGRVGRVCDGIYYLARMDESSEFMPLNERESYPVAEILRTDVQRNVLRLKSIGIEMRDFDMYHKASKHILELADVQLNLHGATDESGLVTPMGIAMNQYPLSTSSGRIMVESLGYPRTIRGFLAAITATKETGGLPYYARNVAQTWKELTEEKGSDLLVHLDLYVATQAMTDRQLRDYGLDVNNVHRAREQYTKIAKIAGASGDTLEVPTPEQRELIKECALIGFVPSIYQQSGDGRYINIANPHAIISREISKRSKVSDSPSILVADAWNVEVIEEGEAKTLRLMENVTVPELAQLGRIAAQHVTWRFVDYVNREGKMFKREQSFLFDVVDLKADLRVSPPDPSPRLRAHIINESINNPGTEQRKLRRLKKDLELLAHKAKGIVPILTQDRLVELIHEAAPADIVTPATIEDNLRMILLDPAYGLTLDNFISPEEQAQIIKNAPPVYEIAGHEFEVSYIDGRPMVRVENPEALVGLESSWVCLPDGREIRFIYHNTDGNSRKYTLSQLKRQVRLELGK